MRRLDLLLAPDTCNKDLVSRGVASFAATAPSLSFSRSGRLKRPMSVVVASVGVAGFMALPSNLSVFEREWHAAWQGEQGQAVAAKAAEPVPTSVMFASLTALQLQSSPAPTALAPPPRLHEVLRKQIRTGRVGEGASTAQVASSSVRAPAVGKTVPTAVDAHQNVAATGKMQSAASVAATVPASTPVPATDDPRAASAIALERALAECAHQSMLTRTWCEHRRRMRFCDTRRDESPECMTTTVADHGG